MTKKGLTYAMTSAVFKQSGAVFFDLALGFVVPLFIKLEWRFYPRGQSCGWERHLFFILCMTSGQSIQKLQKIRGACAP